MSDPPGVLVGALGHRLLRRRPGRRGAHRGEPRRGRGSWPGWWRNGRRAAQPASDAGLRVVHVRTGIVQSARGGDASSSSARSSPPDSEGRSARERSGCRGSASTTWSTSSAGRSSTRAWRDRSTRSHPHPVRNREYASTLARVMRRPSLVPVPGVRPPPAPRGRGRPRDGPGQSAGHPGSAPASGTNSAMRRSRRACGTSWAASRHPGGRGGARRPSESTPAPAGTAWRTSWPPRGRRHPSGRCSGWPGRGCPFEQGDQRIGQVPGIAGGRSGIDEASGGESTQQSKTSAVARRSSWLVPATSRATVARGTHIGVVGPLLQSGGLRRVPGPRPSGAERAGGASR